MVLHESVANPISVTHRRGKNDYRVPPIIWETGNVLQISSLLSLGEAELALTKSQLTGYAYSDWYIHNQIRDLEIKILDLKRWLAEASKDKGKGRLVKENKETKLVITCQDGFIIA